MPRNSPENSPGSFSIDVDEEIYKCFKSEIEITSVLYTYHVVYTDYDNIMIMMACSNLPHFWISEPKYRYSIYVRDRSFDSFKIIREVFDILINYDINLNDIHYTENGPSCNN